MVNLSPEFWFLASAVLAVASTVIGMMWWTRRRTIIACLWGLTGLLFLITVFVGVRDLKQAKQRSLDEQIIAHAAREGAKEGAKEGSKQLPPPKPISLDKIGLFEAYPSEWLNLRPRKEPVLLTPTVSLNHMFGAQEYYRLSVRVKHDISDITLLGVDVFLLTPPEVKAKEPLRFWRLSTTDERGNQYWMQIDRIARGVFVGVDEDLELRFPRAGIYQIRYRITGSTHDRGFGPINGAFQIQLN